MDKKVNNRLLVEDMIDELIDYNIENLADLDRIFRYDGITPFDKMSNARIELEYNEMLENDFTD